MDGMQGGQAGRNPLILFLTVLFLITVWRLLVLAGSPYDLSFDEAQYWLWSLAPDWGYYSKPPFVAWSIALSGRVCGEAEACVRLPSTFAYAIGSLFVFLAARHLFNASIAFWSGLVFLTLPGVAYSSMLVTTDPPLLMFWAVALFATVRALDDDRPVLWWALLGIAIGLGLLAKYAMILFPVSLGLFLASSPQYRKRIAWKSAALCASLALLLYLPNFFWNAANGFVSYLHTKDNANLSGPLFHPAKMGEFVLSQFAVFGPLLFAALLLFLPGLKRHLQEPRLRLLAFMALPILLLMTVESLLSRANANWAAPAYVAASILMTAWLAEKGRLFLVRLSVVLHVVVASLVYNYEAVLAMAGVPLTAKTDIAKRLKGWTEVGRDVSALLAAHPASRLMSDDRKLMASLSYYVRPYPLNAAKWNPSPVIRDTFDLNNRFMGDDESRVVFITERADIAEIAQRFATAESLGPIQREIHPGFAIELHAYLLSGFKGY
ncbi:MAG: glycosyltransferase family 39 protein [Alphaproteobacteria bacterium]|nr:glycosyltransferase family 39 protein [Alphaproteobacteria bacterium]